MAETERLVPGAGDGGLCVEEVDLGAGAHDRRQRAHAGVEHLGEHSAFVVAHGAVADQQVAEFLVRHLLTLAGGVRAEQADQCVGRDRQEPDHRPHDGREAVERRSRRERDSGRLLQRNAFGGNELTQDEREVRDHQGDADEGDGVRAGQAPVVQRGGEVGRDRGGAVRGGEAGDGDADLDCGEETIGIAGESRGAGAAATTLGQSANGSRSETREISVAANTPPIRMNTRTSRRLTTVSVFTRPARHSAGGRVSGGRPSALEHWMSAA